MREDVLRLFFEGRATAAEVARDVAGSVSREGPAGGPGVFRYRIADMEEEYEVRPEHVARLVDAAASGALTLADLDAASFCLQASDHFTWDSGSPEGERVARALFWLGSPEINYPLTPEMLAKVRLYLLTGENTLTRDDTRPRRRG